MGKRFAVGLVVVTNHPKLGYIALARQRGMWNWEKDEPESYSGALQVTCHGGVQDDEDFLSGLQREASQELGPLFADALVLRLQDLKEVSHKNKDEKEVVTYGILLPWDVANLMRLEMSSGSIVPLKPHAEIRTLTKDDRGGVSVGTIAMFDDEQEAVTKALEAFMTG